MDMGSFINHFITDQGLHPVLLSIRIFTDMSFPEAPGFPETCSYKSWITFSIKEILMTT